MVSDKKIFSCFHYIFLCKTYDPRAEPFLAPGALHVFEKLGRDTLGGVTYKIYLGSRHCGFRQEEFFHVFPLQAYVKHLTPGTGLYYVTRGII